MPMLADAHHISSLGYLWFSKERKLEVVNLSGHLLTATQSRSFVLSGFNSNWLSKHQLRIFARS